MHAANAGGQPGELAIIAQTRLLRAQSSPRQPQQKRQAMAVVHKSVLLGYSAEQMYQLVGDIESYPEFLPWCGGVQVQRPEHNRLVATLAIHYRGVQQSFTTENTNIPHSEMQMRLVDGPFKALDGCWRFKALRENACKVEFQLTYEFSNRLLEQVIGPVFGMIANSFVDSFCKRAEKIYG